MKLISILFVLFFSHTGWAGNWAFQGGLGMTEGAANLALDLDYKSRPRQNIGAYFQLGTEKTGVREQFWSLGADIKVFFGPKGWRLYLAPGFGVTSFTLNNGESETTLGTLMKVGTLHQLSRDLFFGLEYLMYFNWFAEDAPAGFQVMNATLRIEF